MTDNDLQQEIVSVRTEDGHALDGLLVWNSQLTPRGATLSMHPDGSGLRHFELEPLARAGFMALRLKSRFAGNNATMIMEEIMLDLAGGVKFLRERGCERVALFGHSGGGPLMAFYQSQAENPTVRSTPAGDPPDLTRAVLPKADGIIITNSHLGRHVEFTQRIDPSVTDESDPYSTDPSLDMYNSANYDNRNGQVVYSPAFLDKYRKAQKARCDRIGEWARVQLQRIKEKAHKGIHDLPFVLYRTMANPRFLDRVNFKSGMRTGTLWGDPYMLNYTAHRGREGPFVTLKSWFSHLYYATANADTLRHIALVKAPLLVVGGTADYGGDISESVYQAATTPDKKLKYVEGASHWFESGPEQLDQAMEITTDWLRERNFS
ncbi:MAG TPA: alpha/beta hydrolase [Candidatus Binatia bacterium]